MNEQSSQQGKLFFYGLFSLLAVLVLYLLGPYLGVIAIAVVTVVLLKPLYDWMMDRNWVNGRPRVATTLTLVSFFLIVAIPIFIVGFLFFTQANDLLEEVRSAEVEISLESLINTLEDFLEEIPGLRDIEIDPEQLSATLLNVAGSALAWLADLAVSLGTSLPSLFIGAIIFLIVIATLLPTMDELGVRTRELSPLDVDITQIYQLKGGEMIVSVIKGVFLLAAIQGLIMGVFYWLAGVPFTIFWMLLSMVFALLPLVGISFIVWFMVIIFVLIGNITSALLVLFGFYVIVNPLDLVLRPRLVSKEAYLNFTLMLLALFGGLAVGGLLGMIYGPVIMVLFITTIDIYSQYFSGKQEGPTGDETEDLISDPLSEEKALEDPITINNLYQ